MADRFTTRLYWMDALNVAACFAVIMLHCSTSVFLNTGNTRWFLDVVWQSIGIFAVPVFFMISGANLIGYRSKYDTRTFLVKRFKRVITTLLLASVFFYIANSAAISMLSGVPLNLSLRGFIGGLLQNKICDVYWFFYEIIGLYLVTPLLSYAAKNKRLIGGLLILSFVFAFLIPTLNRFLPPDFGVTAFSFPQPSYSLFYYLLGFYLVHYLDDSYPAWAYSFVVLFSVVLMVVLTVHTNTGHGLGSEAGTLYDNFYAKAGSIIAAVYSVCFLRLFQKTNRVIGDSPAYPVIRKMSSFSLGIYAVHMLVINVMGLFAPHGMFFELVIRPFVVYLVSLALIACGKYLLTVLHRLLHRIQSLFGRRLS